jgi:Holliday junction resolvasome RuvABC DNA-binding subunit
MIGYVKGVITHLFGDSCYVDVHGVGYRVYVAASTRDALSEGEEVIYVHECSRRCYTAVWICING